MSTSNDHGAVPEESNMAANQATADGAYGHPAMDYPAHLATYRVFTSLIKYGAVAVVLALVLLAFFTL